MSSAFRPCTPCPYKYRRVYAWGGNFEDSGGGLYPNDKTSFIALYNAALAKVNSIDIATVPWGQVRWFNYGGITSTKADTTFIDSGNVANNPTNLPGFTISRQNAPCGNDDFGAITAGGSEVSYMGNPIGTSNPGLGINAGGYQYAAWITESIETGGNIGWFAISRIQVYVGNAKCSAKWSSVQWYPFGTPGSYQIHCDCDASAPSCPCVHTSDDTDSVCIDIPTSFPPAWTGATQADSDLPCFSRYFVPGLNCSDLI